MKQKISTWLAELHSHDIYIAHAVAEDFTLKTGEQPCWPVHSPQRVIADIRNSKAGGSLNENAAQDAAYGYEIAWALALKYANHHSGKMGRGFLFRDCLTALKNAGH